MTINTQVYSLMACPLQIWISPTGRALLYGNIHKPPTWVPEGPQIFDLGRERKGIHLADFNGDGKVRTDKHHLHFS